MAKRIVVKEGTGKGPIVTRTTLKKTQESPPRYKVTEINVNPGKPRDPRYPNNKWDRVYSTISIDNHYVLIAYFGENRHIDEHIFGVTDNEEAADSRLAQISRDWFDQKIGLLRNSLLTSRKSMRDYRHVFIDGTS